jgi:hypothetical protein
MASPGDLGRPGFARRLRAAATPASTLLIFAALLCACSAKPATDANEPNDDLSSTTALVAGTPLDGVVGGADDADLFSSEAPAGAGKHPFVVTVRSEDASSLQVQVGASIPTSWEGITWPGWKPVVSGDRLKVSGELGKGTVLVFLKGDNGTVYSIDIAWE